MRHLQKAEGQDPPLSEEGRANARRLIGFFAADPPRVDLRQHDPAGPGDGGAAGGEAAG